MASRSLDHPVFGVLRRDHSGSEDYPWWEGRARIPSLSTCRRRWAFESDLCGRLIAVVENPQTVEDTKWNQFEIMVKDEIGEGPTPEQERAFTYVLRMLVRS